MLPGLGCEMCSQNYFFWNYETSQLGVAWNQTVIGPTKVGTVGSDGMSVDSHGYTGNYDYNGTFFQSWPSDGDEAAFPLWGWQNYDGSGRGDNLAPRPENIAYSVIGDIAYVEFAIYLEDIVNWDESFTEYAWGIVVEHHWGLSDEDFIGPIRGSY